MSIAWIASTPQMDTLFSEQAEVQAWLDVEAALARAQARLGIVPEEAAREISARADVSAFDLERLRAEIVHAVHPIMPLVRALSELCSHGHGEYVHWGATTQDVLDTGLVLRLRQADTIIRNDLGALISALRSQALGHRDTAMAGRTHGQYAVPISLGYKLAVWVDELERHLATLNSIRSDVMVGQFGGATGTLASLGMAGLDVRRELMVELDLGEPRITWHVARDRLAHHTFVLSMIAASIQRLAAEIVTLQRNEMAEVYEPYHRGKIGSSTMPHKRNPALSEAIWTLGELVKNDVRTALSSLGSLHERDKAVFSVETDYIPRVCRHTHRMIRAITMVVVGLTVNAERMLETIEASGGQLFSESVMMRLAARIGRQQAHDIVHDVAMTAFESGGHLLEFLQRDQRITAVLEPGELDRLFDLRDVIAVAGALVDEVCGPDVSPPLEG